MKDLNVRNMMQISGGESAWVCAGYTAATLATGLLTGMGMVFMAGFTAACWASVDFE